MSQQQPAAPAAQPAPPPLVEYIEPEYAARFWSKVDRRGPDECWPWMAARFELRGGYGAFGVGKRVVRAHRVAWELENKASMLRRFDGVHSCDNPPCVNPRHATPGTRRRNALECYARNLREPANRKLTVEIAQHVMRTFTGAKGEIAAFARQYGVSGAAIRHIVRGRQWRRAVQEMNA